MSTQPRVKIMARYGREVDCVGTAKLPGPFDPPVTIQDADGIWHLVEDPRGVRIIEVVAA